MSKHFEQDAYPLLEILLPEACLVCRATRGLVCDIKVLAEGHEHARFSTRQVEIVTVMRDDLPSTKLGFPSL